eukprot:CAMPEP_0119369302 /NCGR_PEP_ID=MMETSP1334-20130426/15846_1 /TAXON_ID=127549 /ORGANISM="Calcidiscus leptoporus, Strain RCC1130" /LENGTH=253 /DNA_ID=CAMNT_0007386133 /DNA_START=18 /DNA_END=779 /DNA_ORIENTATION=+
MICCMMERLVTPACLFIALACMGSHVLARKQRTSKDWASMTEADWNKIDKDWETPEEEEEYAFKPPKQKGIDLEALQRELKKGGKGKNKKQNAQKMQQIIAEQQGSSGPAMMFATVDYPGCCDNKKMSEELANKWSSLLHASSIEQTAYVVQNNTILFSTQVAMAAKEIKEFVLKQPECVAIEWNQVRTPGPAETPAWKADDAVKKAAAEEKKKQKEEEKEEEEKRKKRSAKKRRKRKAVERAGKGSNLKYEL